MKSRAFLPSAVIPYYDVLVWASTHPPAGTASTSTTGPTSWRTCHLYLGTGGARPARLGVLRRWHGREILVEDGEGQGQRLVERDIFGAVLDLGHHVGSEGLGAVSREQARD